MHFASLLSLFASFGILVVGSPTKVEVVAARAASYPTYTCTGEIQVDEITVEPHSEFLTCCKDGIGGEGGPGNPEISTGVNCKLAREIRLRRSKTPTNPKQVHFLQVQAESRLRDNAPTRPIALICAAEYM